MAESPSSGAKAGRRAEAKALVPDLLTGANLCMGFACVLLVLRAPHGQGTLPVNYLIAAWLILAAAIIDGLDGAVARRVRMPCTFGMQFDSLADLTSFAVAPAVLLYACFFRDHSPLFLGAPFVLLVASAWRLARFNADGPQPGPKRFIGLPTTCSGILVASTVLFFADAQRLGFARETPMTVAAIAAGLVLVNSLLMVSAIRFEALSVFFLRKDNRIFAVLAAVSALASGAFLRSPAAVILVFCVWYAAVSVMRRSRSG